jgi:integrase/recombinase XerD
MKPSTKILLVERRAKMNGKYPVKLQIIFQRTMKQYPTGIDLSPEEFNYVMNHSSVKSGLSALQKRSANEARIILNAFYNKANEIITRIEDFSFELFERKMNQKKLALTDVFQYYEERIRVLREKERIGTAETYQNSLSNLKLYRPKLTFKDITVEFLEGFEAWMLKRGRSVTTVGVNLRPLRAILNEAIADGIISRESNYPFGKHLYQIPAAKNIKKALSREELSLIFNFKGLTGTWQEKARDYFVFSYLGNGINMKDIALLKNSNIEGEFIRFVRAKTQHTHRTATPPISILISTELQDIINRQRNVDRNPNAYLFPVLTEGLDAHTKAACVKQFTRNVNENLKRIAQELGIDKNVTTYFARHSFATTLKRSGANIAMISEFLGHTSIKTTTAYLDSFEDEKRKEVLSVLTNF